MLPGESLQELNRRRRAQGTGHRARGTGHGARGAGHGAQGERTALYRNHIG
ncbi:MAG: hypothetical protein IPI69_01875 [Bacteroidales bacterium]|nr:hypothetical protein [Bacteroidales bacterium]